MNRPFADATQRSRASTLFAIAVFIAKVRVGSIHRVNTRRATCHHETKTHVVPHVARVVAVAANHGIQADAHRGREISHAEHQALEPIGSACDRLNVLHTLDFFDQRLQADSAFQLELFLHHR